MLVCKYISEAISNILI